MGDGRDEKEEKKVFFYWEKNYLGTEKKSRKIIFRIFRTKYSKKKLKNENLKNLQNFISIRIVFFISKISQSWKKVLLSHDSICSDIYFYQSYHTDKTASGYHVEK